MQNQVEKNASVDDALVIKIMTATKLSWFPLFFGIFFITVGSE